MLCRGNLDYFLDSVEGYTDHLQYHYSATKESGLALSLSLSRNAVFVAHFMTGTDR